MPSPYQTKETTPRVNLRHEREHRSLTIKDIHIRVGIPLEHIEALESGVVPQALRGKKLLRSKQAYLSFLGFPKHSKLDVRRRRSRAESQRYSRRQSERTGSTEIVVPTTSKSIFTGFGLAVAMVLGLKTLSLALDNPSFSLEGMLDAIVEDLNDTDTSQNTNLQLSSSISQPATPLLTSTTSGLALEKTTDSLDNNIDDLVKTLTEIEEESETAGPIGPHEVSVKVDERSRLFFVCDGHLMHKGSIQRGDTFTCNFSKKAIVDIHDPAAARITHNAKRVRPMGPQGSTRRLSFVHNEY